MPHIPEHELYGNRIGPGFSPMKTAVVKALDKGRDVLDKFKRRQINDHVDNVVFNDSASQLDASDRP